MTGFSLEAYKSFIFGMGALVVHWEQLFGVAPSAEMGPWMSVFFMDYVTSLDPPSTSQTRELWRILRSF